MAKEEPYHIEPLTKSKKNIIQALIE